MKLHPFLECAERADKLVEKYGCEVFQQFNCQHCGSKQTVDQANTFFEYGECEKCKGWTNVKADGCNYAVHFIGRKSQ